MPAKNPYLTEQDVEHLRALGKQVRARRKHLKLSATVAAEAAHMSRVTWYRIEKGEPAVTMGAWLNAVTALGLSLEIPEGKSPPAARAGWIPARVPLDDYPQLKQLAWHVGGTQHLSAREALDIYERNQRHLDTEAMTPNEHRLLETLRQAFGKTDADGD